MKKYTYIFSDGQSIIAIKFDKKGNNKLKSDINIEDQEEMINIIDKQKVTKLKYEIIKKEKPKFKTRIEIENKEKLLKTIAKIYNKKEYDKINYIYLECFNKLNENIEKKYKKIKKEIMFDTIKKWFKNLIQVNRDIYTEQESAPK